MATTSADLPADADTQTEPMPAEGEGEGSQAEAGAPASTSIISLRILELLAEQDTECGVTHLAEALGLPKARVHRHLTALKQQGYVTQNLRSSRYRIGWRLFLLGQRLVRQFNAAALARPVMEELRDKVGQTIVITNFTDSEVVVLDLVRSHGMLEILLNPGTKFHFHTVAQGKIALAFGPKALLENVMKAPLVSCTPHTIIDHDRLLHEIELVRKRGWAEAPEEVFMGVNALAAPLHDNGGEAFGALAVVGSIHYLPAQANPVTVQALKDAAAKISGLLGQGG